MGHIIAIRPPDILEYESLRLRGGLDTLNQTIRLQVSYILNEKKITAKHITTIYTGIDPYYGIKAIATAIKDAIPDTNISLTENRFINENIDIKQLQIFLKGVCKNKTDVFIVIAGLDYIGKLASVVHGKESSEIPPRDKLANSILLGSVHYLSYNKKKKRSRKK